MGVYGEMLDFFPEQLRSGTYFDQQPKINDGYDRGIDPPPETPITGVFQNNETEVHDKNGNLVKRLGLFFWTATLLSEGQFIRFSDIVFRIVKGNEWKFEGGFYQYPIERLVGSNGDDATEPAFNTGSNLLS